MQDEEHLRFPVLRPPYAEDHPLLAVILDKRREAAGTFTPEFSGQRFADFDRGLMCAFEAVNAVLQNATRHQAERETLARMEPVAWMPIETAPKDGTRILVYSTTEPPHYDDQQYIETICDGHHVKEVQPARWISEDNMWELMYIGSPLFWMPLPPAPEAGQ